MGIWVLNMVLLMFWWVWYMGFVGFVNIILILYVLHICSSFLCIVLCFVLCCTYHVYDKMSLRCFCVSFWIPWNTKVVGIIMFLWFWNITWLYVFTLCIWCTHTHTHTQSLTCFVLNVMILSCFDVLCLHMSFFFFWINL